MVKARDHCCEEFAVAKRATKNAPYHFVDSGLPNVFLVGIRYFECEKCGTQAAEIPAVENLMQTIARAIVENEAQLTGAEIRFLRKRLRQKAAEFAQSIGVSPEQVSRWENNSNLPEKPTERLIRAYYGLESGDEQLRQKMTRDWFKNVSHQNKIEELCGALSTRRAWNVRAVGAGAGK